jgi:CheY-like chemotaxis protein
MSTPKRILFVDDAFVPTAAELAVGYMWYYTKALEEAGFQIVVATGPDEALAILSHDDKGFALVIVDVMMPPGRSFAREDTVDGLRTGVFLAKRLAVLYGGVPVIILTNADPLVMQQHLKDTTNIQSVLAKVVCTPFDLVDEVQALTQRCKRGPAV